jgi:hypothetical protein
VLNPLSVTTEESGFLFYPKKINNIMVLIFSFFALRYFGVVTSTVSWYEILIWVAIIKILEKILGDEKPN